MVLHAKIITEGFKIGTRLFRQYYRLEGKAFNRLYTGFPASKTIGRGVRHGLTAGSLAGSLINDAPDSPGNGQTVFQKTKHVNPSRQSSQTRRRSTNRYCPERPEHKRFSRY